MSVYVHVCGFSPVSVMMCICIHPMREREREKERELKIHNKNTQIDFTGEERNLRFYVWFYMMSSYCVLMCSFI